MTPSKKVFALAVSLLSSVAVSQAKADPTAQVLKADGSFSTYKLLPLHHVPMHAAEVKARLMRESLRSAAHLPAQYQIPTKKLPAIRDQGNRGTCAYFATVGILESYFMGQSSSFGKTKISEECLVDVRNWMADNAEYTGEDKPDMRPDPNGDLPQSIIKTIAQYGVPVAKSYSQDLSCEYNGDNENGMDVSVEDYTQIFSSGASPAYGKDLKFHYDQKPTIDSVKALIAANIPVEVGVVVYNEYMYGSDWRFDPAQDTEDNIAGGHAIMLTGYKTSNGKTIFTFKNSWGTSWGKAGYGTMDDALVMNSWGYDPSFDMTVSVAGK
jgi:C1A family cysteine protease